MFPVSLWNGADILKLDILPVYIVPNFHSSLTSSKSSCCLLYKWGVSCLTICSASKQAPHIALINICDFGSLCTLDIVG